ncbi:MAG TPA: DNA-formamidopyrimidine glycosylase family protein, partial [Planctomycetota bacterium]|nr:DNA-formamidopyrimidine glycosylase family protein [Planctomycetota bacterium]
MPELPDLTVYVEAIDARARGETIERVRVPNVFVVRTFDPPIREAEGKRVVGVRRIGKRIVLELEGDLFLAIHLMIAGRLHWLPAKPNVPPKRGLAAIDFAKGTLLLTEAGSKRRAAIHLVRGAGALAALDRGGVEPLEVDAGAFAAALRRESRTLKRALTDPATFAGIGNAYSDEIL